MGIEKIKQGLLKYLEMETARKGYGDKEVILVIIHVIDFIDEMQRLSWKRKSIKNARN